MSKMKCSKCNGKGHIEKWAKKRIKNQFINRLIDLFRISTCEYCIGTGIDLHKMSNDILFKSIW
jgi:hypothetical protein